MEKKNKPSWLKEVDTVRAISCLLVVLLHSIHYKTGNDFQVAEGLDKFLIAMSGLMAIGTTAFIFISEMLLSKAYPKKLPNGFYLKRLKFIFLPFMSMSIFYAVVQNTESINIIPSAVIFNIFGYTHWFILVILQFYLLHHFYIKYLKNIPAKYVLLFSLAINLTYLCIFNFYSPQTSSELINYIWKQGYWVPFLGWIFYFSVAYYCGLNYEIFIYKIKQYRNWIFCLLPISIFIVLLVNNIDTIEFGSKRIDMIPFTIMMIFTLFIIANKMKNTPSLFLLISKYSFGIYLLHSFYLRLIYKITNSLGLDLGYSSIVLHFVFSVCCSILTIYILNQIPFGKYIVGNVKNYGEKSNIVSTKIPITIGK